MLKMANIAVSTIAGGITGLLFGKDAGTLMMAAVLCGCIIYNVITVIKEKSN